MKPFLESLSTFWNRLFADSDKLSALYDATYASLGQVYLELLETVLSKDLVDTPVFAKEYWRSIGLSNTEVFVTGDVAYPYGFYLQSPMGVLPIMQNSVVLPDAFLEKGIDYEFIGAIVDPATAETRSAVKFASNPFTSGTSGVIDGFAWKNTTVSDYAVASGVAGRVTGFNLTVPDAVLGDALVGYSVELELTPGTWSRAEITSSVSSTEVTLDASFATATGFAWRVLALQEVVLSVWVPDAEVDVKTLYDNFGVLVRTHGVSSEAYKALLTAIFSIYTGGPLKSTVESAINTMHGYPLIATDGEVLTLYEANVDGTNDRVTTTGGVYLIPKEATRADVKIPGNYGALTFRAYEVLSDIVSVYDDTILRSWWWNELIPPELMGAGESDIRRTMSPKMYVFNVGTSDYPAKIGDLGLTVGDKPVYRHSYAVMDTYLRHHVYGVLLKVLPALLPYDDMRDILVASRVNGSYPYIQPRSTLTAGVTVGEVFSYSPEGVPVTVLTSTNPAVTIGSGWSIGEYYWYDTVNTIATALGVPNSTLGQTPIVVGGNDPYLAGNPGTSDWPVQVTTI